VTQKQKELLVLIGKYVADLYNEQGKTVEDLDALLFEVETMNQ